MTATTNQSPVLGDATVAELAAELRERLPSEVDILGPTPAFYERTRDMFRWQLVIKSPKRSYLLEAIKLLPPAHWQFELDPISLL